MPDEIQQQTNTAEQVYSSELFDYEKARVRFNQRIADWKVLKEQAEQARKNRYIKLDVKRLRADGVLDADETLIPTRVIDSNIGREKADAMAFLNGIDRLIVFRCEDDPLLDVKQIETDVTKGLSYPGWYKAFDKHYDGAALHGWGSIEVIFDETKPLHVRFDHVGFDKLLFNTKLEDIQDDEFVMREVEVSCKKLDSFVTKNNFDKAQVDLLLARNQNEKKKDNETFKLYKVYFKVENQVYVTWYSPSGGVTSFLRQPELLISGVIVKVAQQPQQLPPSIGGLAATSSIADITKVENSPSSNQFLSQAPMETLQNVPATMYPYFLYLYKDDEQEAITEHKGRDFLDSPMQEARTAVISAYVNSMVRASQVYASPDSDDPEAASKLEETTLENGVILPVPLNFHNQPYPDPSVLQGLQFMDMQNSSQMNKMAATVSNRKDARKTSREISFAQNEDQKITSTNLATYSEWLRDIFGYAWNIIQSRALAEEIKLCLQKVPIQAAPIAPGMPPIQMGTQFKNNLSTISKKFDIRPAGDVDVVQRQQTLNQMKQDWPVFQSIPGLNTRFLEDIIRLAYPLQAESYIAAMKQGNMGKQVVQSLLETLKGSLQPEELQALNPQEQQQLQQVVSTAQQYLASPV